MANILVIDDDRDILQLMDLALTRGGHQPITTISGNQGLQIIQESRPHLVIVDLMMPEMTGYEFIQSARTFFSAADLPIIVYSARAQSVDRQAALEAGATDYLPKTISPIEMIQRINNLLGTTPEPAQTDLGTAIACFSLSGGTGVTSLTTNLAIILAMTQKKPICLTDLNPIAGHTQSMLGLQPQKSFVQLLTARNNQSVEVIKSHLTLHKTGVQLLASSWTQTNYVDNQYLPKVMKTIRAMFPFTIIDLPSILNHEQYRLLAEFTKIVLILTPNISSIQSAIAAMKYLTTSGVAAEKIIPVLNQRCNASNLSPEAVQKIFRRSIMAEIPFDQDMNAAIRTGNPLVLYRPKSATAAELARLAAKLVQ